MTPNLSQPTKYMSKPLIFRMVFIIKLSDGREHNFAYYRMLKHFRGGGGEHLDAELK